MTLIGLEFICFGISIFVAALFSYLETSFTALRLFKLKELSSSVSKYKRLFDSWEKNPQRILITILIANNFAHVSASVLIAEIMQHFLGNIGLAVGAALATILILIFGEIIPKSIAKTHHQRLFVFSLGMVDFLFRVLYPVVTMLLGLANFFFAKFGRGQMMEKQDAISEKEIEFLIDYSDEKGLMEAKKTEMLQNIFDLGEMLAHKVMVPQMDMVLLNSTATIDDAIEAFSQHRYSRIPIYQGKEDNIIGIVYQKDLFELIYKGQKKPLKEIVRPVLFVPETKQCNQLLSEFLKKRMHMAIVIDEYGAVVGLVTLEDLIEEIVGDIRDEDEKDRTEVISLEQGGWLVDAGIDLDKVEELLDITFQTQGSVTLAGFLAEELQHLPRKGERVFYSGYCFQIQQASPRRVFQVLIFKDEEKE
jgi:putative hemolysin